jgi:signal transduction histidine kinase
MTKPAVLVVDDTEANLIALEAVLASLRCEVLLARNGNDALRILLKRELALVLLDVQMPEMDGYEVARLSRSNPATRDVPIIFVTAANETIENELRGYGSGAVDYLFKPVNPHVLRSKAQVFLELYEARRRLAAEVEAHEKTLADLRHVNRALEHFTHAASHDLGAPLRAMTGFLEALDEESGTTLGDQGRHYLARARNASARMRALLDSLLVFAGLRREATPELVDCRPIVDQVREDLAKRLTEAGATLTVGELPTVRGDRGRLYQLFLNLVGNAIKYHAPGAAPHASVYVVERDGEHVFCVEDNGIGIAPEHHGRVFDAFERLHGQSAYEGTGLGLAICRQIVEQHRGRIWVESEPGEGARFCFTLAEGGP